MNSGKPGVVIHNQSDGDRRCFRMYVSENTTVAATRSSILPNRYLTYCHSVVAPRYRSMTKATRVGHGLVSSCGSFLGKCALQFSCIVR
ncbi:MAG: hypothetical protein JWO52_976 [Gammaproteobacteria bacterium]|nr:hypothetical protein [Gammaproteobacteria bacterium]